MPGRRRSTTERLSHLVRESDMYLHGYWQHEIAAELGISRRTVGNDLVALHKIWEKKALASHEKMLQQTLARIDWLERQAYEQWQLSLKGSPSSTTSYFETDESGEPLPSRAAMREIEDEGRGDIMWWNAIARCAEMRVRVLERGMPLRLEIGEAGTDWDEIAKRNLQDWTEEPEESDILVDNVVVDDKSNGNGAGE